MCFDENPQQARTEKVYIKRCQLTAPLAGNAEFCQCLRNEQLLQYGDIHMLQAVRRSSVRDPVLLLDEVDKMGHDSLRGDPASALLEVLDPNQNQAFVDTYLSVPFDLSQV